MSAKVFTLWAALSIAVVTLVAVATAPPAAAWPNKVQNCSGCHSTYPAGTLVLAPSSSHPAPSAGYTLGITIPQNTHGTYGTGYWIANSNAAGATGTSVQYGGSTSSALLTTQTYTASRSAPAAEGVYYYLVFGQDGTPSSGMTSSAAYSIVVDTTAPVTASAGVPAGWSAGSVDVTLNASDATSTVSATEYQIDGRGWQIGTSAAFRVWRRGGGNGDHVLSYRSTDQWGNVEVAKTAHVKIDTRNPVTANDAPAASSATTVTVHLTPTDSLSGVASTTYCLDSDAWTTVAGAAGASVVVPATNGTHWIGYYSTDTAGNVENARYVPVTISGANAMPGTRLAGRTARTTGLSVR